MNRRQKERERKAEMVVDRLLEDSIPPERVLAYLREIARDPRNINYTPHLITALRDGGYWPLLERVDPLR